MNRKHVKIDIPARSRIRGHLNRTEVDDLMHFQSYIKEKYAGQVFEDSAELLNQIREERMRELENGK